MIKKSYDGFRYLQASCAGAINYLGNNNDIPTLELQKNKSPLEISKLAYTRSKKIWC